MVPPFGVPIEVSFWGSLLWGPNFTFVPWKNRGHRDQLLQRGHSLPGRRLAVGLGAAWRNEGHGGPFKGQLRVPGFLASRFYMYTVYDIMYMYICIYVDICIHVYKNMWIYEYIFIYIYVYIHICICVHVFDSNSYVYVYVCDSII